MTDHPLFYASYVLLWLLVLGQSLVILGLMRTIYTAHSEPAEMKRIGPRPGEKVPAFSALDLISGRQVRSSEFLGKLTALLFVSPHCASCMTTLEELNALKHKARGNVVLICRANSEDCARLMKRYGLALTTLIDEHNNIGALLGVTGTPYSVVVDEKGEVEIAGRPLRTDEMEQILKVDGAPDPTLAESAFTS